MLQPDSNSHQAVRLLKGPAFCFLLVLQPSTSFQIDLCSMTPDPVQGVNQGSLFV